MVRSTRHPRFEIWQVGQRIHSEENPVRLKILRLIESQPRRLTDLVQLVAKAKSTLSALHMPPLVKAGLVEEVQDAADARVKIYRIKGHRLGSSDVEAPRLRDAVISYAQSQGVVPFASLVSFVEPGQMVVGASPSYVKSVARRLGEAAGRSLSSTDPSKATAELSKMLSQVELGTIAWEAGVARVRPSREDLSLFVLELVETALLLRTGKKVAVRR